MNDSLIKRMRKARERTIEVEGFRFTYLRPTDTQAAELHHGKASLADIAKRFVIGWSGVKESDLFSSGGSDDAAFSPDVWAEWCDDMPQFWVPLGNAVIESYAAHVKKREAAEKN